MSSHTIPKNTTHTTHPLYTTYITYTAYNTVFTATPSHTAQIPSTQASPHWPSLLGSRRVTQERRGMFSPVFCRFDFEALGSPQTQSVERVGILSRLRGVPTFCPNFSNIVSLELLKNALTGSISHQLIMRLLDPPKMGFFSEKKEVQLSKPKKRKKIHDKSS